MGKTYKDKDRLELPRVPSWARPKPTKPHKGSKKDRPKDDDNWIEKEWNDAGYD